MEAENGGFSSILLRSDACLELGEGELEVLLHGGEVEVLAEEEEQSVEEGHGGVHPQLLTVPQELFLHIGTDDSCPRGADQR